MSTNIVELSATKSWRSSCKDKRIHILRTCDFLQVQVEDIFPPMKIRQRDNDLTVKSPRTNQGLVKEFREVGCTDHNDAFVWVEPGSS